MPKLTWLHLSDLHQGMDGYGRLWPRVEQLFLDDLTALHPKTGPWDVVFFTGDLAYSGSTSEYERLDATLDKLWKRFAELRCDPLPLLLAVPGNHDLVWPDANDDAVVLLTNLWHNRSVQSKFWNEPKCAARAMLDKAFSPFVQWWDRWRAGHPHRALREYVPGHLPGDFRATVEKDGLRLGVVGLNSAFLQLGKGDHKGKLCLAPEQLNGVLRPAGVPWFDEHDLCVLLTHHPADWLDPAAVRDLDGEIAPPGRFAAHLFGHMHESVSATISIAGAAPRRRQQALSVFGLEAIGASGTKDRRHGYAAWQVHLADSAGARLRCWPRAATARSAGGLHIVPDTGFDLHDDQATAPEAVSLTASASRQAARAALLAPPAPPAAPSPAKAPVLAPPPAGGPRPPRRVFVSYTAEDLVDHADVVIDEIRKLQWLAVDHRDWAAGGLPSVSECRAQVAGCDLLVVLVAHRYGWVPTEQEGGNGEHSIVWLEVEQASAGAPPLDVLPFLVEDGADWPVRRIEGLGKPAVLERLGRFKQFLSTRTRRTFTKDPESLRAHVLQALYEADRRLAGREASGARPPVTTPEEGDPIVRYRRWVEARYRNVSLIGFGEQFQIKLPIDRIYVPLTLSLSRGAGVAKDKEGALHEAADRGLSMEEAFRRADAAGLRGVALRGDPGAGKTTAALRVGWQCADPLQGSASLGLAGDLVPVVLRLRSLLRTDGGLREFLTRELKDQYPDDPGAGERLWRRPAAGRPGPGRLWILDGLDEVADPLERARVSGWIERMLQDRPEDRFLVTSRDAGYQGDVVLTTGFLEVRVQPLTGPRQEEFVRRWFSTVETQMAGATAEAAWLAETRGAGLIAVLTGADFRSARLMSMAANPLLLSILCVVYRKDLDLPRRRAELYSKCVDVLLDHWRKEWRRAAGLAPLDVSAAREVLKPLAAWLHTKEGRTEAESLELAAEATTALSTLSVQAGLGTDGAAFLKRVRDESGLLVSLVAGRYSFLHSTFQEYLAACHACERRSAGDLAERFKASWWQEVVLLALSQASADWTAEFFTGLLASGAAERQPELFALALLESLHLPLEPFVKTLSDPAAPPERLALVLRNFGSRTDAALVSAAEALARHPDPRVAGAAAELLLRAGKLAEPGILVAGSTVVHPKSGITLVYVPAGAFDMGSPETEKGHQSDERLHRVQLSAFWMAKFSITNEEYARFLHDNPSQPVPSSWTDSRFNQPKQPVVGVSWNDATAYCRWSELRLPTEAQWEYACRAGTTTPFHFGSTITTDQVNYDGNYPYGGAPKGPYRETTVAVGTLPPNAWGLHEMHGNVWEWCEDVYDEGYYGRSPANDPLCDSGPSDRVVRGGSWYYIAFSCRSAYRFRHGPGYRLHNVGFRPARPLP
ncbi:MAG: SUMF1/EgtB/PvdO family nonheme iron enzyme [Planctomycetes bacterium]|nr:SUMF1/EgtB/PvdO family nonheme iron enzyme [Planctomycetota bacterium]